MTLRPQNAECQTNKLRRETRPLQTAKCVTRCSRATSSLRAYLPIRVFFGNSSDNNVDHGDDNLTTTRQTFSVSLRRIAIADAFAHRSRRSFTSFRLSRGNRSIHTIHFARAGRLSQYYIRTTHEQQYEGHVYNYIYIMYRYIYIYGTHVYTHTYIFFFK